MRAVPGALVGDLPLEALIDRLAASPEQTLPVMGDGDALVGVLSADDLETTLADGGAATASELARPVVPLRAGDSLERAASLLGSTEEAGLPVLAAEGSAVIGWIGHRDILRAYLRACPAPGREH